MKRVRLNRNVKKLNLFLNEINVAIIRRRSSVNQKYYH